MPPTTFEDDELFRFEEIAYDVGLGFGATTEIALARCRRAVNRAMLEIAGFKDKKWSWLRVRSSFNTASGVREYSLDEDVKVLLHVWMEGSNRQKLRRPPTGTLVERFPNPETTTGAPYLYDEDGVDSSGCKNLVLYPVPSGEYEIFYRHIRQIKPIREGSKDVRVAWGLPQEMRETLVKKATAIAKRGVDSVMAQSLNIEADEEILEAYNADQENGDTEFRAPLMNEQNLNAGDPLLPPEFGL